MHIYTGHGNQGFRARRERGDMLDWDSLRYFLEVARTQRASAAARKLGVEHTTVSRRIRALEAELDTLLFDSRAARASC